MYSKKEGSGPSSATMNKQLEEAFQYIESHPEIRDMLSGGDPLSLSDKKLDMILTQFAQYTVESLELVRVI